MKTIKSARAEYKRQFRVITDDGPGWSATAPGFKAWARRAFKAHDCVGKLQKIVAA